MDMAKWLPQFLNMLASPFQLIAARISQFTTILAQRALYRVFFVWGKCISNSVAQEILPFSGSGDSGIRSPIFLQELWLIPKEVVKTDQDKRIFFRSALLSSLDFTSIVGRLFITDDFIYVFAVPTLGCLII